MATDATFPQRPLSLNAELLVRRLHTIKGLHNYNHHDFVEAVEFIESQHERFPFEQLVHDRFTLDQTDKAFDYGLKSGDHRVGIRTVFRPA